jgi:ribosomal protein S18 acetylase RimI-like enzyme
MAVTIRRAVETDAQGLSRLAAITFPLACTPQTSAEFLATHIATRLDPASFRDHLTDPACVVLLAEDDDGADLVGYTMLLTGEPTDPDVAQALRFRPTVSLERCYVHPDHHGTGVAGELMNATLAAASSTGAEGIWLGVSEENDRANAFYARHGFEQIGKKRFPIGDAWEDDNVRERAL